MHHFLELHILQSLPPNCINRDGEGRPKTGVYGARQRMRVSSQAWKRAIRDEFRDRVDANDLASRSRDLPAMIASRLGLKPDDERLVGVCKQIVLSYKLGEDKNRPGCASSLQFLGESEWAMLADIASRALDSDDCKQVIEDAKTGMKKAIKANHALDIAMFGRMAPADTKTVVTDVDAAVNVAQILGVNQAEIENDYFAAVDEAPDVKGAGMIGETGFTNGTVYRYMSVDLPKLTRNLCKDKDAVRRTVETFIPAAALGMPKGRIHTFAANTLPTMVLAVIRDDRPVNLAKAFETPITGPDITGKAILDLLKTMQHYDTAFCLTPAASCILLPEGADETTAELLDQLGIEQRADIRSFTTDMTDKLLDEDGAR